MTLINCEISVTWTVANKEPKFAITDTKLYVPVVTLLALKTGFKITINWNKYRSKPTIKTWNRYLNYLNDLSFQWVNRPFVLSFEKRCTLKKLQEIFFLTIKNEDYNVMIDGKKLF